MPVLGPGTQLETSCQKHVIARMVLGVPIVSSTEAPGV